MNIARRVDVEQAIAICREHLPQQPGHMSGHIVFGQALFDGQQFDEARTVFETALTLDPENLIALRHLGDIALTAGDSGAASGWYQRVLDADPRNEEIAGLLFAPRWPRQCRIGASNPGACRPRSSRRGSGGRGRGARCTCVSAASSTSASVSCAPRRRAHAGDGACCSAAASSVPATGARRRTPRSGRFFPRHASRTHPRRNRSRVRTCGKVWVGARSRQRRRAFSLRGQQHAIDSRSR